MTRLAVDMGGFIIHASICHQHRRMLGFVQTADSDLVLLLSVCIDEHCT